MWCALRLLSTAAACTVAAATGAATLGSQSAWPVHPAVTTALDAHDAKKAADYAKNAANVAHRVAAKSVRVARKAHDALERARSVVKAARLNSVNLSSDQRTTLESAEARLKTATNTVDLHNLATKRSAAAGAGLEPMQGELRDLRDQLARSRGNSGSDKSIEQMDVELQEMEDMLAKLAEEERGQPASSNGHEELKVEIDRLRTAVDRLNHFGGVRSTLVRAPEVAPEHAELRYRIPTRTFAPATQLTPLADESVPEQADGNGPEQASSTGSISSGEAAPVSEEASSEEEAASGSGRVDVDMEMPYGELEPFGREDTAQELTESSIKESDEMVDQLERAEVAEEKRAVFRALTRLRGAAITSFDGVARSQTGNIDEYNKVHKWRSTHPLNHLADEEADVSRWAFPDTADFF